MKDYIVRATAAEGQIRAFAITSRELVETARQDHNTSPVATAALGRLLSAGAMMGVMMKGEKDVLTLQIRCNGPIGGLTVTADAHGNVKGFVENPDVMLPPNAKGKLANKELRQKRIQAHRVFDQIWLNHIFTKSEAYRWIADKFCLTAKEAHIGEFSTYMCDQLIMESMKILENNHIPLRAIG